MTNTRPNAEKLLERIAQYLNCEVGNEPGQLSFDVQGRKLRVVKDGRKVFGDDYLSVTQMIDHLVFTLNALMVQQEQVAPEQWAAIEVATGGKVKAVTVHDNKAQAVRHLGDVAVHNAKDDQDLTTLRRNSDHDLNTHGDWQGGLGIWVRHQVMTVRDLRKSTFQGRFTAQNKS